MENEFDQYEFENYLTNDFFSGNDKSEIGILIKQRLEEDDVFKEQYELWLEESSYNNWKEFYQEIQDEGGTALENMYPDGDED